jgi:hypothetical protein
MFIKSIINLISRCLFNTEITKGKTKKTNYKIQFSINPVLKDKIKKKSGIESKRFLKPKDKTEKGREMPNLEKQFKRYGSVLKRF